MALKITLVESAFWAGWRPLGIPAVKDRVVQAALKLVIEPIFEHEFEARSFGFRQGLGCKDALREVDRHLKAGHVWVVDADLQSYFDTIPHGALLAKVGKRIADGRVFRLVEQFLKQDILDDMKRWTPAVGSLQGAVISPLLANIYLHELDVETFFDISTRLEAVIRALCGTHGCPEQAANAGAPTQHHQRGQLRTGNDQTHIGCHQVPPEASVRCHRTPWFASAQTTCLGLRNVKSGGRRKRC